jgi:hypothetical protein
MAQKKTESLDPYEVLHLQVAPGATVTYDNHSYGDRSTLQIRRRDLNLVEGDYTVLDSGADVPDVADR